MMRKFCLCLCLALTLLCMSAATAELSIDFDANLVSPNEWEKGIGAWNADQTVFESYNGELYVAFKDVVYGTKYRVALFVPSAEGVIHSYYTTYEFIPDWPYLEMVNMISASTGKYENVTLVVSGNGEVVSHTFTLDVQGNYFIKDYASMMPGGAGLYFYDSGSSVTGSAIGPVDYWDSTAVASLPRLDGDMTIAIPQEGAVYDVITGNNMHVYCEFDLSLGSADNIYELANTCLMTNKATGQVFEVECSPYTGVTEDAERNCLCLTFELDLPDEIISGEYELYLALAGGQDEGEPEIIASDTVSFKIEKSNVFEDVYSKYLSQELKIELNVPKDYVTVDGEWIDLSRQHWNDELTAVRLEESDDGSEDCYLVFNVRGLKPDTLYRMALKGKMPTGEALEYSYVFESLDASVYDLCWFRLPMAKASGRYEDLTLMIYSDDEAAARTFDCELVGNPENADSTSGLLFVTADMLLFNALDEDVTSYDRPDSGVRIYATDGDRYAGYPGNQIRMAAMFGPELTATGVLRWTLVEEATGRTVFENQYELNFAESSGRYLYITMPEDFASGMYLFTVEALDVKSQVQIQIIRNRTPSEALASLAE